MDSAQGVSNGPDEEELRVVYPENANSSLTENSPHNEEMFSTELPPGYNPDSFRDHVVSSVDSSAKPGTKTRTVPVFTPEAVKDMYLAEVHAENKSKTLEDEEEVTNIPQKIDERRKSRNEIFKRRRIMVCLVVVALVIVVVVLTNVFVLNKTIISKNSSSQVQLTFLTSQISMVSLETAVNADGRVELFGIDSNMQVYVRKQLQVNSMRWSNWTSLNGPYEQIGVALVRQSGKLTLVATTNGSGSVWATTQVDPNSAEYAQWQCIGGCIGGISAGGSLKQFSVSVQADGRIVIFGVDLNNMIQTNTQTTAGAFSNIWTLMWANYPAIVMVRQVGLGLFSDGRLQLFGVSTDGNFWYHMWTNEIKNNYWYGFQNSSNVASQIVVQNVNDMIGRPYLFGINKDNNALLYIKPIGKDQNNNTGYYQWTDWNNLDGSVKQIKTVYNAGLITVFAIGNDFNVSMISQVSPGADWGSWQQLIGYKATQISVVANAVGCVELFGIHPNMSLWTTTLLCSKNQLH